VSRCQVEVDVTNQLGLHLRAAAAFAKLAERYQCDVTVGRDAMTANGKSVIALVTLAAAKGSRLSILGEGSDAEEAVGALVELVEDRFGEDQ
jgi:phosphocarrier protein